MTVQVTLATIDAAASLSGAIDLGNVKAARISMPADWTAADLTFQVLSSDGSTYQNLYDKDGIEYTVTASEDREIILPVSDFLGITQMKIRSGTSAVPVV